MSGASMLNLWNDNGTVISPNSGSTIGSATDVITDGVTASTQSLGDSTTKVATTAFVADAVATVDTWAEVLALGNTSGATDVIVTAGQKITVNTIDETTGAAGVTIDGTLIKDGVVTADLTGNVTGNVSGSSGSCTGESATVANATFTTALTVNTGTLTLTAHADNDSVLTIGKGAVSISGANTGDQSAGDFNHDDLANITGTAAQYNHPTDANMTVLGNTSGTNSGDGTYGIADTNYVQINSATVADDEYARFTATGLESRSTGEVLSDIGAEPAKGADDNYVTDAQLVVITNTSGSNTGDNTVCTSGTATTAATLATARDIGGVSFDGSASIVPTTIVVADTTDTTCFVGLWESATGSLLPKSDAGITYNAGTANLATTTFTGALAGNATTATDTASKTGTGSTYATSVSPVFTTPNIGVATGSVSGNAGTVSTITGLAPDTATTQATQAGITTCANLTTVGTIGAGVWEGTDVGTAHGGTGASSLAGASIPTYTSTNTFTNKRTTARVLTFVSDATPDVDSDSYDAVTITAQAAAITDVNVTGTPTNFQKLIFRILDDGTARAITWGADFQDMGVALPTTTVISKVLTVGFIYDTVDSKWGCVSVAQEL